MNHLAHVLLSGSNPDVQLGGMLGDFVRGAIDGSLRPGVQCGLALHRAIDSFTDNHADIVAARNLFEPPYRRYAGILIDVWFDHLLATDFTRWSQKSLESTSADLLALLESHCDELPPDLQRFARYLKAHDLPTAYRHRDMIGKVLVGVGSRLSRENPLASGLIELNRLEASLARTFESFFPQLVAFAEQWHSANPSAPPL
jgi:acyl carrier protein phosphodiesterase